MDSEGLTCSFRSEEGEGERTVLSVRDPADGTVTLRAERPALLLSSTSWTGQRTICSHSPHTRRL